MRMALNCASLDDDLVLFTLFFFYENYVKSSPSFVFVYFFIIAKGKEIENLFRKLRFMEYNSKRKHKYMKQESAMNLTTIKVITFDTLIKQISSNFNNIFPQRTAKRVLDNIRKYNLNSY